MLIQLDSYLNQQKIIFHKNNIIRESRKENGSENV